MFFMSWWIVDCWIVGSWTVDRGSWIVDRGSWIVDFWIVSKTLDTEGFILLLFYVRGNGLFEQDDMQNFTFVAGNGGYGYTTIFVH